MTFHHFEHKVSFLNRLFRIALNVCNAFPITEFHNFTIGYYVSQKKMLGSDK